MNNVMLINLPIQAYFQRSFRYEEAFNPSLGLMTLGTWLELNGYKPTIIDLCFQRMTAKELLDEINEKKPILIGISVYTENIQMALSTAKLIKESFPNIKIVLGGPHPSLFPEDAINSDFVDFVIRKEGEAVLLELAEAVASDQQIIKYEDIPGLVFKQSSAVIKNKLAKAIKDLDILPITKREYFELEKFKYLICISTSRGCPSKCIYCAATALTGGTYRVRNIDNVFLEIILYKVILEKNLISVSIVDDTFTVFPQRVLRFTSLIKEYKLNIAWQCESRIDVMSKSLIDEMASSRCVAIQYGIESGSQEVLDKVQKGINLNAAKEIIAYTHEKNVIPMLSFIIGHYCDTKETMEETINLLKEMSEKYSAETMLSYNTPFPGTWQYNNREKLGMSIVESNYKLYTLLHPIVETEAFTINDQRTFFCEGMKFLAKLSRLDKMIKREELI